MTNEKRLIELDHALQAVAEQYTTDTTERELNMFCDIRQRLRTLPTVDAVEVEKYKALVEMYHDLRENFIDYVCSGTCNVAPYCLNRCEGCVDRVGWCSQGSDECHGFNPAEVILDGAKMDGGI